MLFFCRLVIGKLRVCVLMCHPSAYLSADVLSPGTYLCQLVTLQYVCVLVYHPSWHMCVLMSQPPARVYVDVSPSSMYVC